MCRSTFSLLEGQISYAYTSIPEAFENIAQKVNDQVLSEFYSCVGKILKEKECEDFSEAWNQGLKRYIENQYLSESDCRMLKIVGTMPVYLDGSMQIKVLEEAIFELDSQISEAEKHIQEKCKVYKCTGFAAGVFIVLILI